jgi:hypothetical protein
MAQRIYSKNTVQLTGMLNRRNYGMNGMPTSMLSKLLIRKKYGKRKDVCCYEIVG